MQTQREREIALRERIENGITRLENARVHLANLRYGVGLPGNTAAVIHATTDLDNSRRALASDLEAFTLLLDLKVAPVIRPSPYGVLSCMPGHGVRGAPQRFSANQN